MLTGGRVEEEVIELPHTDEGGWRKRAEESQW